MTPTMRKVILVGALGALVLPLEVWLAIASYANEYSNGGEVKESKKSQPGTNDLTFENTVFSTDSSNDLKKALDTWHSHLALEIITRFDKASQSLAAGGGERCSQINYTVENGELVSAVIKKASGYAAFDINLLNALRSLNKSSFLKLPNGLCSIRETITFTRDLGLARKASCVRAPTKFPSCFPKTN